MFVAFVVDVALFFSVFMMTYSERFIKIFFFIGEKDCKGSFFGLDASLL